MNEGKARAIAMAERLEMLANGLERSGLVYEAGVNRKKAAEIRAANK